MCAKFFFKTESLCVQAYTQRPEVRGEEGMAGKDAALSAALKLSAVWNEGQLLLGASTYLAQFWSAVTQVRLLLVHWHLCHSNFIQV